MDGICSTYLKSIRRRWEDNIKMIVKEIWSRGVDMIHLTQNRVQ